MTTIPTTRIPDSTIPFRRRPYQFINNTSKRLQSKIFKTRLLFRKAIMMQGKEAATLFYDDSRFKRKSAMPKFIQKPLAGFGSVQGLDGAEHKHRKRLLMEVAHWQVDDLVNRAETIWHEAIPRWEQMGQITFYDEMLHALTKAVCDWAHVPLDPSEVSTRATDFANQFGHAGSIGPRYVAAVWSRVQGNHWVEDIIEGIRKGDLSVAEGTPAWRIAFHKDLNGNLLDLHDAAVALINILRPTTAVAVYLVFVAHALHQYPEAREQVTHGDDATLERFAQEVRRHYPFFPTAIAKVRHDFEHEGCPFHKNTQTLLDLHGTNHDPDSWDNPQAFNPDRFLDWNGEAHRYDFIPQGGGDPWQTHRCAGEKITVDLMKAMTNFLIHEIRYDVPAQNLALQMSALPPLPESHFIMSSIRRKCDSER